MKRRQAPSGIEVEELVGPWPHLYRILHPAWMAIDNESTAARWSEVAAAAGAEIDLSEASC